MITSRHRKIRRILSILACAGALWAVQSHSALAATTGLAGGAGSAVKLIGDALASGGIFYFGLYVLMGVLTYSLGLVGSILDYAFMMNTYVNPGQLSIVRQGWLILRDLANGVFILLLLWIAITIIFDLGQLGGKRFLIRIIMVALLINFSLAMVSTVFALGNKLAEPFAKAMDVFQLCMESKDASGKTVMTCPPPKQTLSQVIITNSQIHETTKIFTDIGALNAFKTATAEFQKPQVVEPITSTSFQSVAQYFGAPPPAQAGFKETASGVGKACLGLASLGGIATATGVGAAVGVPAAVAGGICSLIASVGIPLAAAWFFSETGVPQWMIQTILNLVIADAFLLITVLGMLTAAVILLLRLVAMAFLGVFAPVAFLGLAFPKFGDKIWSLWIDNLFRWAFTAPIFYFLLYLALLMLQSNSASGGGASQAVPFAANFFKILNLVLFLFFLWAAVYMTRKTAGHFADVALNLGRKAAGFGLGVATGFAARGVARGALRFAPQVEKTMNAIGRTPLGLALGRRTQAYIQKQRKRVEDLDKEYEGTSEEFKEAQLRSTRDPQRVAAIGRAAVKDKQWEAVTNTGREDDVLKAARLLKLQGEILQKLLHRVEQSDVPGAKSQEDAIAKVIRKITDKSDIDAGILTGEKKDTVLNELWKNVTRGDLTTIGYKNKNLQKAMTDHIESLTDAAAPRNSHLAGSPPAARDALLQQQLADFKSSIGKAREQEFDRYFAGSLTGDATHGGWNPNNWTPPTPPTPGPAPSIVSVGIGRWTAGAANTFAPRATGGSGTYTTWRFAAGFTRPTWLSIDPRTGTLSGTPPVGMTPLTVPIEVVDDTGAVSPAQSFVIRI